MTAQEAYGDALPLLRPLRVSRDLTGLVTVSVDNADMTRISEVRTLSRDGYRLVEFWFKWGASAQRIPFEDAAYSAFVDGREVVHSVSLRPVFGGTEVTAVGKLHFAERTGGEGSGSGLRFVGADVP